ncbi:MAG: S8 family peptidase [Bdellovibrionales bacterium]|nr:S8 family peptidase [Bdellovibrionales bacterium]
MSFFINKIEQYLIENVKPKKKEFESQGKPKHKNLIESIESIQLAVLESFWQDDKKLIPKNNESVSCEVWLRVDARFSKNNVVNENEFFNICDNLNERKKRFEYIEKKKIKDQIEYIADQKIYFPERTVVLVKAKKNQLMELIKSSDQIAEFRKAKETARFWLEQENKEQEEWVEDLERRLKVDKESKKVSVCLLDTGVNNGHPFIKPVLSDEDCHTIKLEWETDDKEGHGTLMSGLIIYGDLQKCLESRKPINIRHKLESVKLIPSGQSNPKKLYGDLTKQGINRVEIEKPKRKRTICMAVTSLDDRDKGRPSSWSGAIDQITSGAEENDRKRLLIVSAGNVEGQKEWNNYPNSNLTNTVHDPAQSWNALTVGAYTEKAIIKDPKFKGYKPIAKRGELSPFSSTSCSCEEKWPIKPDIVLEGGNIAKDEINFSSVSEDLSLLSLHHKPQEKYFQMFNATSATTAQASWMASQIQIHYPEIWPETIRALMVHSSDWKENMKKQFWNNKKSEKRNYKNILRIFGYGVPNLNKAISSYKNSLTLVSEQTLQPFKKDSNKNLPTTKDMHFYKMPWPKKVLKSLPDQTCVRFKFTLSYFVEPGPGEIGWKDKYRYPSFGLRFALIKPQENEEQFKSRINKVEQDKEQNRELGNFRKGADDRWMFGKQNTYLGSIHSDIWEGSAQEIASCNLMAVCPTTGWWKERFHLKQYNKKARYSLIVSLSTPETNIDLYTSVATQIDIPIK